jgi:hypothetical protein
MSGGQKTAHKNPMSDKPVDEQMLLFAPFFSERHNRVFDIYDALPRFVLSWKREADAKGAKGITFSNVRIGDQTVAVTLTPAIVHDPHQSTPPTREGAPRRLSGKLIFPGPREEIIEFALRRMAAVQYADMSRRKDKDTEHVTVTFRLSDLRGQLAEDGHQFKSSEIAEALEVLAKSQIQLSGDVPDDLAKGHRWTATHPYSMLADMRVVKPKEGETPEGDRTSYFVSLHPLAAAAILQGRFFDHNHRRTMQLRKPLARWLIKRMSLKYRQAARGGVVKKEGYNLSLSRIVAESGILPDKRLRDTVLRIREAIQELSSSGWLSRWKGFDEVTTFDKTASGQKAIKEIVWTFYPSSEFITEIIEGNDNRAKRIAMGKASRLPIHDEGKASRLAL